MVILLPVFWKKSTLSLIDFKALAYCLEFSSIGVTLALGVSWIITGRISTPIISLSFLLLLIICLACGGSETRS